MGNCLGIYMSDKIVKYAKLTNDSGSAVRVIAYGAKSHLGNKAEVIKDIILATGSENVPVCLNVENCETHKIEVLRQISKNDIASLIDLEVLDYTKSDEISNAAAQYKYILLDSKVSRDNAEANILIANKHDIEKIASNDDLQVTSMYDLPYILDLIAPKGVHNYCIVNMSDTTELIFVEEDRLAEVQKLDVGMSKIFKDLPEILGSSQKCYEVLKSTNVYTDQENVNNPEVEKIIEPVLQTALNRIQSILDESKHNVEKIYLTGDISLFINSELLFQEYFDRASEKLKPYFIDVGDVNYNLSEITEATAAFALAYEGLFVKRPEIDMIRHSKIFARALKPKPQSGAREIGTEDTGFLSKILKKGNESKKTSRPKANSTTLGFGFINFTKVIPALVFLVAAVIILSASYVVASKIYVDAIDAKVIQIKEETDNVNAVTKLIEEDVTKIKINTAPYKKYVDYIKTTNAKIANGEIGRSSTYNVALFMLKVSKYIPNDVRIISIESDDSKNVVIVAESSSYAEMGYLVSQMKFQGVLNDVAIKMVEHNDVASQSASTSLIRATIGGVLP